MTLKSRKKRREAALKMVSLEGEFILRHWIGKEWKLKSAWIRGTVRAHRIDEDKFSQGLNRKGEHTKQLAIVDTPNNDLTIEEFSGVQLDRRVLIRISSRGRHTIK